MQMKIQNLRETKKEIFAGIDDIRSETDRTGLRTVIELKKGTDPKKMLDCLFKYSDLQITYGINIVAIAEGQPKQLGLLQILDYYIAYQRKVVTRRVRFDIEQAQEREHRLAGLIVAVQNIDLVVKLIRSSANTREAKQKLMEHLNLTGVQAQAILDMRLAKLTQLEIDDLMREYQEVLDLLAYLNDILSSREKLDGVIIDEIKKIKSSYSCKRRTEISSGSANVVIDLQEFKAVEDCVVIRTKAGNFKRMTPKAYTLGVQSGEPEERNKPQNIIETTTADKLMLFTSKGNLHMLSVESIREAKYKDSGSPLNSLLAGIEKGEKIIYLTNKLESDLLTISSGGLLKYTDASEFDTKKRSIAACGLRDKDTLFYAMPDDPSKPNLLLITKNGYSILVDKTEISKQGRTGTGVGGIRLGIGDRIIYAEQVDENPSTVFIFTDAGYAKKTPLREYELQGRNGKGQKTCLWSKDGLNGSSVVSAFCVNEPAAFLAETSNGEFATVASSDISAEPRYSNGMPVVFPDKGEVLKNVELI